MKRLYGLDKVSRNRVWCTVCESTFKVSASRCMYEGWPKCCGYTMTIDSPEERAEMANKTNQ